MPGETAPQLPYPLNLLTAVKGSTALELPVNLSTDIQAGLHYALSTLTDAEKELVYLHYAEGKAYPETADLLSVPLDQIKTLHANVLKKLRIPSRWNAIQYGIAGNLKFIIINHAQRCHPERSRGIFALTGRRQFPKCQDSSTPLTLRAE